MVVSLGKKLVGTLAVPRVSWKVAYSEGVSVVARVDAKVTKKAEERVDMLVSLMVVM
jgi:hypothetical protein